MKFACYILVALWGTMVIASAVPGPGDEPERPERKPSGERAGNPRPGDYRERRGPSGQRRGRERDPRAYAENFLRSHDSDKNDEVSFEEFQVGEKMQKIGLEGRKRIFDHLDKNGDGKITRAELPEGVPSAGNGNEARRGGDTDGDGKISPQEFAENPRLKDVPAERRQELFQRMDHDGDGFLTREDWRGSRDGNRRWGRGPMLDRDALKKLDENKDQALSFEEWRKSGWLKDIGEERLKELFKRQDRNGDGKLDEADRPTGLPRRGPNGERSGPEGERPGGPPRRSRPDSGLPKGPGAEEKPDA